MLNVNQVLNEWKNNKTVINNVFQFLCRGDLFYHDSLKDIVERKEVTGPRLLIYQLKTISLAIFTIKCIVLALNRDQSVLPLFGEAFHLVFTKVHIWYALFAVLGFIVVLGQLTVLYLEYNGKLMTAHSLFNYLNEEPFYILSKANEEKLLMRSNIIYQMNYKVEWIPFYFICFMFTWLHCLAYYYHADQYNSIVLLLNLFNAITFILHTRILFFAGFICFYIIITFFNYKLDEITQSLRIAVRWRNRNKFIATMSEYDKLTKLIEQNSPLINSGIGNMYVMAPYFTSVCLQLVRPESGTPFDLLWRFIVWVCLAISVFMPWSVSMFTISITTKNKAIVKNLYRMFITNNIPGNSSQNNLSIKKSVATLSQSLYSKELLKIDSFIDRLNSQFIGFYCFNLYKITKLAFYNYWITLSSCYFLITGFIEGY